MRLLNHSAYSVLCGELSELAEGARLEIVYTPKGYQEFKSLTLRQIGHHILIEYGVLFLFLKSIEINGFESL